MHDGGGNSSDAPAKQKFRREPHPDLSESVSDVPVVQSLVLLNNAERNPKKRLKLSEFLNHAFVVLAEAAVLDRKSVEQTLQLLTEFIERHRSLPKNTSLSKVLFRWVDSGLIEESIELVRKVLNSRFALSQAFANTFDERVATVALRALVKASTVDRSSIEEILALLPDEAYKRRLFLPLFQLARREGDAAFALSLLRQARERSLELWDVDFHEVLGAIQHDKLPTDRDLGSRVDEVLRVMEECHPVVGAQNATLLQELLGGTPCSVSTEGKCSHCGCLLRTFDLASADRLVLLHDITEQLVRPRVMGTSRYEPEKHVTSELQAARWKQFDLFKAELTAFRYDAVIDGANVGYYGLSNWYPEAKEELLRSEGVDPQSVPLLERSRVPIPVDVAPKFAIIENLRQAVRNQGKEPIILLHKRHAEKITPENERVLSGWLKEKAVLFTPCFLNDDYCWLYACLIRPSTFLVSNDQMRDHHFSMLSPRCFIRWRQRHRITFTAFYQRATKSVSLLLHTPRQYSVWVQPAAAAATAACTVRNWWHIPYISTVPIIDQATNRTVSTENDVGLSKNGDDECSAWLCTFSKVPGQGL